MKHIIASIAALSLFLALPSVAQKQKKEVPAKPAFREADFKAMQWRNIGPFRGGRANTIAGVIQDPMTYYTGYTGGGIWKTDDGGATWRNISDGFFSVGTIGDIAVSESDPNVVYGGTGEHAVRGVMTTFGNGVYKSTDAGATWTHIGLEKTRHISDVAVHPSNPEVVLVGAQGALHGPSTDRGVYKSTDGGLTWKRTLYVDENTGVSSLQMDMNNPRILYAAMWHHRRLPWKVQSGPGSSIWKSTDMGETWTRITDGLPAEMGKIGLSISRANSNRIFALIEAEKSKAGIWRSDDGGKKWVHQTNFPAITARSWYYMEVYADPSQADVVYALNAPVFRSIDGGKTFEDLKVVHGDCHDLWINPKNSKNVALADDGGGSISYNYGKTWSSLNNQPTAQFYRVNTDNRMPYWVYGGQQDNLSVCIPSRNNDYGILTTDWFNGPGCESAYIAFDNADDPRVLYGSCYQGSISLLDTKTMESKDIMAYPATNLAMKPKDMKYRFNWNAPLLNSLHEPGVMYHAANVLLKSSDGGMSWAPISPDLTRNDTSRQGASGGPITNEGAGGENYNTIYYVAQSPHERGVIYTGSDCGKIFITRDGGTSWNDITPADLPESQIHSLEVSAHDKATIYVSANRYKFNDFSSRAYRSDDYGKTWVKINEGVEADDFIKVIREDRKVPGLLYAGSERGFYLSLDKGNHWNRFRLNLPIVPVTDLAIRDNDLIASTAGRSFWILDDLSPLQQQAKMEASSEVRVKDPKPAYRMFGAPPFFLITEAAYGKNPPEGVTLDYYLRESAAADTALLRLEILDEAGKVIRTYTNRKKEGSTVNPILPVTPGHNRFTWDFRVDPLVELAGTIVYAGDYRGHRVAPGKYTARFSRKGDVSTASIVILPDPNVQASPAMWQAQQQFLSKAEESINSVHRSINEMRGVRKQLETLRETTPESEWPKDLQQELKDLNRKLTEWESKVTETRQKGFQDALNWPNKVNAELFNIRNNADTHDPRVPKGYLDRLKDLQAEWELHETELNQKLRRDIEDFNQKAKARELPALRGWKKEKELN